MKKIQFFLTIALFLLAFSSCHLHGRTKTVEINNGDKHIKIKYRGNIVFTDDETGIVSISPNGYIKYRNNTSKLIAESDDNGNIDYEIFSGGLPIDITDKEAIKIIKDAAEHYYR